MAVSNEAEKDLVYDIKLSSVVPGKIVGENKTYELKGIDLAMKLHYLKGLYFFTNTNNISSTSSDEERSSRRSSFIDIYELKKPMFEWLISYFIACGRIRAPSSETGERPTIKLNDAGIRIVEAQSSKTVEEWLAMEGFLGLQDHLIYDNALGPDLPFSPLVYLQITWFRCGGIAVGLSWAHVLGDAFSATEFINMLGQHIQGHQSHYQKPKILALHDPPQSKFPPLSPAQEPISVKRINPVGNHWVYPANCKIGTHAFHLTPKQLGQLHSRLHGPNMKDNTINQCFEVIASVVWKSIAKLRKDMDTKVVTICRLKAVKRQQVIPYNGQIIGTITVNFSVSSVEPLKLVRLIVENVADESGTIEELVSKEMGKFDFIVYGTNLTFVDMEEADIYGFKLKGKCPRFASYTIGGIGDKGVVLVHPYSKEGSNGGNRDKLVVVLLPENEIEPLKRELKEEWSIE